MERNSVYVGVPAFGNSMGTVPFLHQGDFVAVAKANHFKSLTSREEQDRNRMLQFLYKPGRRGKDV